MAQADYTSIRVRRDLRERLAAMSKGDSLNDTIDRLWRLHHQEANAGGVSQRLIEQLLTIGFAGQTLEDIVLMEHVHFMQCRSPGGAGTLRNWMELRREWANFQKQREQAYKG